MGILKKTTFTLLASVMMFSTSVAVDAEEKSKEKEDTQLQIQISAESAVLYDVNRREIVFEKNANKLTPTASLTKIMTLALASEDRKKGKFKNEDMVPISINAWAAKIGGSKMFLEVGREFPFQEIMKGLAVVSGNDAAIAMAEYLNGTTDSFIDRMNKKAKELGMLNTHFITVNGYPKDGEYDNSTAKDMALLSAYYMREFPENKEIHLMESYTTDTGRDEITQTNANKLLGNYDGVTGLKTGYVEGHYNIVASAERKGVELIAVVMTAPSEKARTADAKTLLDYGYSLYKRVEFNEAGDVIETVPVYYSDTKKTKVVVNDTLEVTLHQKQLEKLKEEIKIPNYLKAPLEKGEKIGTKNIYIDDELVHSMDIVVDEKIEDVAWYEKPFHFIALVAKWIQDKIFD